MVDEQLRQVSGRRKRADKALLLGDVAGEYVNQKVLPLKKVFEAVAETWELLLPAELIEHCRIEDFRKGVLRVKVDNPAYATQLRWCSSSLVPEIRRQCPEARIKSIKIEPV